VWSRCDAIEVLLLLGRFDEAQALLAEARELQPQGIDAFRTEVVEGHLWMRRGDLDRARDALVRAEGLGARIIDPHLLCPLYASLVEVAVQQGAHEAAARWSEDGLRRLEHVRPAAHAAPVIATAATACVRAVPPRLAEARELLDRAGAMVAALEVRGTPAEVEVQAAQAELADDAPAWREVAAAWQAMGEPYRSSYAHLRAAQALLASASDREEAAEHLRTALETARRIGAAGLVAQAEDLARRSRIRVQAAADNPYGVTNREAEVLELVAQGLTDRQIGNRLFISHRTVERHVSNLLAKLGAERRSELVAVAMREDLLHDDSSAS
jgi:DNA-binding NarL/FixJ family response regulator